MIAAAESLLKQLLDDPQAFWDSGQAHDLVKAYYAGHAVVSLRPLLASDDVVVLRLAAYVVSELGEQARPLLADIVAALAAGDRYVTYNALEALIVAATGSDAGYATHVFRALESEDSVVRRTAIRLLANATAQQVEAAHRSFVDSETAHAAGTAALLNADSASEGTFRSMLEQPDAIERAYGGVAALRRGRQDARFVALALECQDDDVRDAAQRTRPNVPTGARNVRRPE